MTGAAEISYAQGEHGRRAGAELRVLTGDIRQLDEFASAGSQLLLQQGLQDRIQGSLSAIDILMRLADQEVDRESEDYATLVKTALSFIEDGKWTELSALLSPMEKRFPLLQPQLPKTESSLISSRDLHQRFCAACHDTPVLLVERPAYNLYQQSQSVSDSEFFARMLVGVRGDRVTGIDNPFSDAEIAGLIHLYKSQASELNTE